MGRLQFLFIFSLCFILSLQLSSALSLDLKPTYQQSETLISQINGSIVQISNANVELLRGHVQTAFDFDVKKLGDSYYIYGIAPSLANNYTLLLRDVETTQNGVTKIINISYNFTVTDELASYSVKPGAILTQDDFTLTLTSNKGSSETLNIGGPQKFDFIAKPGTNTLEFSIDNFPPGFSTISVASYSIPVYIIKNQSQLEQEPTFIFTPQRIHRVALVDEQVSFQIQVVNNANITKSIEFIFNNDRFSISPKIKELKANSAQLFNITIDKGSALDESIEVHLGNETFFIPLDISYTENRSEVTQVSNVTEAQYYCAQLNGVQCSTDQICSSQTISALDGSCCLGTCSTPANTTSYSKWVGYTLGAVVLIILVIIGGRYLKSRGSGDTFAKRIGSAEKFT